VADEENAGVGHGWEIMKDEGWKGLQIADVRLLIEEGRVSRWELVFA